MANIIKFTVGGIHYAISSDDSEEYIRALGRELERKMDLLAKQSPFLSTTMVAVLAAIEAADGQKKAEAEAAQLRRELKEMTERYAVARSDADRLSRQLSSTQEQFDLD
ncbi:MAG: cell division protein ZapA [Clostridia bacterium]|nr:cell division protein ZapA [Clostridia bacterium]